MFSISFFCIDWTVQVYADVDSPFLIFLKVWFQIFWIIALIIISVEIAEQNSIKDLITKIHSSIIVDVLEILTKMIVVRMIARYASAAAPYFLDLLKKQMT